MNRDEHRGKVDTDEAPASPVTGDLTGSDRMLDRDDSAEPTDVEQPPAPPHPRTSHPRTSVPSHRRTVT